MRFLARFRHGLLVKLCIAKSIMNIRDDEDRKRKIETGFVFSLICRYIRTTHRRVQTFVCLNRSGCSSYVYNKSYVGKYYKNMPRYFYLYLVKYL